MLEISAGAIIYTYIDSYRCYLLIRDFHGNYGFPKGHLEDGESLKDAAIREIREEVGLEVELDVDFREDLDYIMPNGIAKKAVYFIASYQDQTPQAQEEEVAEILLLKYEEALEKLTFANMKEALKKAEIYLYEK